MDFEIFESECPYLKAGEKFSNLEDVGKRCPWLYDSASGMTRALQSGGTLPWYYKGTPYEKILDKDGVTTEFVRCPDPVAKLVLKIIRTELTEEQLKELMDQKKKKEHDAK